MILFSSLGPLWATGFGKTIRHEYDGGHPLSPSFQQEYYLGSLLMRANMSYVDDKTCIAKLRKTSYTDKKDKKKKMARHHRHPSCHGGIDLLAWSQTIKT